MRTLDEFAQKWGTNFSSLLALIATGVLFGVSSFTDGQVTDQYAAGAYLAGIVTNLFFGHRPAGFAVGNLCAIAGNTLLLGPALLAGGNFALLAAAVYGGFLAINMLGVFSKQAYHAFNDHENVVLRNTLGEPRRTIAYSQIGLRAVWFFAAFGQQDWADVAFMAILTVGSLFASRTRNDPNAGPR